MTSDSGTMYLSGRNKREWKLNSSIKCKFHRQLAHASVAPSSSKRRLQRSSSAAAAAADSCFWMARASLAAFNSPHQLIWSRCVVILLASLLNMSCDVLWYDLRDLKSIYSTKSFTQLRLVLSSSTWRWLSGTAASAKKSIESSQFPDFWATHAELWVRPVLTWSHHQSRNRPSHHLLLLTCTNQ